MTLVQAYRRKKFGTGGTMEQQDTNSASSALLGSAGTVASFASTIADAIDPPNRYGKQSMGTNVLKGAVTGAQMGAALGPIGMGAGAVLGAGLGVIRGNQQRKEAIQRKAAEDNAVRQQQLDQYAARAASDSSITSGIRGKDYYANGGSLFATFAKYKAKGGSLSRLSEESVDVKGPSHAQGGVHLGTGDEVEGGETIKGDYVFSKQLGFAQLHRPIAKAIGKIEQKPITSTTLGSLERLRRQEDALMLMQEQVRQQNNLE